MMDQEYQRLNSAEDSQMYLTAQLLLRKYTPRQDRRMNSYSRDSVTLRHKDQRQRQSSNIQFQDFIYS